MNFKPLDQDRSPVEARRRDVASPLEHVGRGRLAWLLLLGVGCTLTPQADVADFFWRSRGACQPPPSERGETPVSGATLVPSAPVLPPGQNVIIPAAPQTGPAPADATLPPPKREGHPWFRPFRRDRT
jgi:hypothetical protein